MYSLDKTVLIVMAAAFVTSIGSSAYVMATVLSKVTCTFSMLSPVLNITSSLLYSDSCAYPWRALHILHATQHCESFLPFLATYGSL